LSAGGGRLTTRIGFSRHSTMICWPGCIWEMSTSTGEPAAIVSAAGSIESRNGQATAQAPTAALVRVTSVRKSRRFTPSAPCSPAPCVAVASDAAILHSLRDCDLPALYLVCNHPRPLAPSPAMAAQAFPSCSSGLFPHEKKRRRAMPVRDAVKVNAAAAGQFAVAGEITINRLGFGAMRITGPGIWGEPEDRSAALATLRALPGLGVNFVDTADSYGPYVSELLIREALHPYRGMLIATKGGLVRTGPVGRPEYLRQEVMMSLRRLGLERIDLWQLHRIDPKVPRDEQFDAVRAMRAEGLIRHVGLSEVNVAEIEAAQKFFPVVTVQNRYNLADRAHEAVLDHCARHRIGFIPWFPLAAGDLARPGSELDAAARRHKVHPAAIALAWVLQRSPVMLPIPGTGNPAHLAENVAAAAIRLSDEEYAALDRAGAAAQARP
jgi:aryl-alcohol dehydrogenase-like predicted oxidoreductase